MNTNRPGTKLHAIENNIVGKRAYSLRIRLHAARQQIVFVRRGEGMMGKCPGMSLLIPLEKRKIRHPQEFVIACVTCFLEGAMLILEALGQLKPDLACLLV